MKIDFFQQDRMLYVETVSAALEARYIIRFPGYFVKGMPLFSYILYEQSLVQNSSHGFLGKAVLYAKHVYADFFMKTLIADVLVSLLVVDFCAGTPLFPTAIGWNIQ